MGARKNRLTLSFLVSIILSGFLSLTLGTSSSTADSGLSASSEKALSELNDALSANIEKMSDKDFQINFETSIVSLNTIQNPNFLIPQTLIRTGQEKQKIFAAYVFDSFIFGETKNSATHMIEEDGTILVDVNHVLEISGLPEEEKNIIENKVETLSPEDDVLLFYNYNDEEVFPYILELAKGSIFVVESALPSSVVIENTEKTSIRSSRLKNGGTRYTVVEKPLRTTLDEETVSQTTKIFHFNKKGRLTRYKYYAGETLLSSAKIVSKITLPPLDGDVYMPDEVGLIFAEEDFL